MQGNGTAQGKKINANATAVATNMTINATSQAYKLLDTEIGINPTNVLSQFIYYTEMQTATEVNMLYHMNKAIIKLWGHK